MGKFAVILPAAGRSSRFGDPKQKKIYAELEGRAVWLRAVEPFVNRDDVEPDHPGDRAGRPRALRAPLPGQRGLHEHQGDRWRRRALRHGRSRPRSRRRTLRLHRGARRSQALLERRADRSSVCRRAASTGPRYRLSPVAETIKRAEDGRFATETVSRAGLYLAQTPQAFERGLLCRAYAGRHQASAHATDDCQLVEALGDTHRGRAGLARSTSRSPRSSISSWRPPSCRSSSSPGARRDHIRSRTNARCGPICPS